MLFDKAKFDLDIPAVARFDFMNTADQGPKPACVHHVVQELENDVFCNSPSRVDVYERLHAATEASRRTVAGFFHCSPGQAAFVRGIADGLNLLLPLFELGPGDEVITTDQENPAVLLPLLEGARRRGYAVRFVRVGGSVQEALDAMDEACNAHTRLAVMSHVSHIGGFCQPAREISEIVHRRGGRIIWDGAQSAGQIPVDFPAVGCDVYIAAGYKWMLGLHGTSVMMLDEAFLAGARPHAVGVGSEQSFSFDDYAYELRNDARKFEYGSRYLPPFAALGNAVSYLSLLGIENIAARNRSLKAFLMDRLRAFPGIILLSPDEEAASSGIVGFTFPDLDADDLVRYAWERRILVKTRNLGADMPNRKGIRVSLHFFNTEEEILRFEECLKEYRGNR